MRTQFVDAVDTKVVGANQLHCNKYELRYLPKVIAKLEKVKKYNSYPIYYIECLPIGMIANYLRGLTFKNNLNATCSVDRVWLKDYAVLVDVSTNDRRYSTRRWTMMLSTLAKSAKDLSYKKLGEKYFIQVTRNNVDYLINHLKDKIASYNNTYKQSIAAANDIINKKIDSYTDKSVVTRTAVKRAMLSVRKDAQVIADAFNSTLTNEEQEQLISYLKKNIYSMRLYTVKDTEWDQALTEMYPDEQYGLKRRTEASESSKNRVGGYISVNSIEKAPLDVIQKITHKLDKNASFIQNKGSTKYRLNNYMLVLFLLNNYNKDGFVTGKTNLCKSINS